MEKFFKSVLLLSSLAFFLIGCGGNNNDAIKSAIAVDLLGNYKGIQPSYNMRNVKGEDMVVNGENVLSPSSAFNFLIKENNILSLQLTNLEDNISYSYEGTYKILNDTNGILKLECTLSDGENSNPIYILEIDKLGKKGKCIGNNEPEFNIEKVGVNGSVENSDSTSMNEKVNQSPVHINIDSLEVKIGEQTWTIANLDIGNFRNGDVIKVAKTKEEWVKNSNLGKPVCCYYDYDSVTNYQYGKLYNWYAVSDKRGLAPQGFHIPSEGEWEVLRKYLNVKVAGTKMKSKEGWEHDGNGTNTSGFNGLPGGYLYFVDGSFEYIEKHGNWWSSTPSSQDGYTHEIDGAYIYSIFSNREDLYRGFDPDYDGNIKSGYSVRCVRD